MPPAAEVLAVAVLVAEVVLIAVAWCAGSRRVADHTAKQGPRPHVHDHPAQAGAVMLGIATLSTAVAAAVRLGSWETTWSNLTDLLLLGIVAGGMAGHSVMVLATRGQPDSDKPCWALAVATVVATLGGAVSPAWVVA
ncbi:hypothetical protein [Streptomyces cucumeris]|uniref:hypothetical protein n=1 Tax=Streptomyces TaxID=1883 RepID=UPI003D74F871